MKRIIPLILALLMMISFFKPTEVRAAETYTLVTAVPGYLDSYSASAKTNSSGLVPAGTYNVYKTFNGMINVSAIINSPGSWINPAENVSSPTVPSTEEAIYYKTTAAALNFRSGPSTAYSSLGKIPYGTIVTLVSRYSNSWYRVLYNGTSGYVATSYLTLSSSVTPPSSGPIVPVPVPVPDPTPVPILKVYMKTTASNQNFRSGPSTTYSIIGKIPFGSTVEILEKTSSTWYKISFAGKTGYASTKYLISTAPPLITPPTQDPVPAPVVPVSYVTTSGVNFRSGPAVSYSILSYLSKGTEVNLISTSNGWSKVVYSGKTGFISASYLALKPSLVVKPKIGLTWMPTKNSAFSRMADAIVKAGGIVVELPNVKNQAEATAALNTVNGVIFTSGGDVDPKFYGETLLPTILNRDLEQMNLERDISDLELMKAAFVLDKPTLGICRGAQVMAIAAGGTLYQDIPSLYPTSIIHRDPDFIKFLPHPVNIISGTGLANLFTSTTISASSWHHQGINSIPASLVVSARSDDGMIEGIEMPDKKFMIGVQFHPEYNLSKGETHYLEIFKALIKAAQ